VPHYRLGKKPPRLDKRTLKFGKYLTSALPPPPVSVSYFTSVPTWPMMANDIHGDCTCAAAGHLIEQWTQQATGTAEVLSDAEILAAYHVVSGGVDDGADLLTVLQYWSQTGFTTNSAPDRITAYAALDTQNEIEAQNAISIFGGAYLGLALPDFAVNPPDGNLLDVPWVLPSGAPPKPNPMNGHCVCAVGYDAQDVYVVTWGTVKQMSWDFYNLYADEAYTIISPDWLGAGGTTVEGFDMDQLTADLAAIRQSPTPAT
jgi:hypothetical protein